MTENERQFYLLLCMSGRTEEAMAYKERIEGKEAKDNAGEEDQTV
jgi:hypothetical protein|nr:MAG TPA: hypothetical protein [Caudoviricetes sp.]